MARGKRIEVLDSAAESPGPAVAAMTESFSARSVSPNFRAELRKYLGIVNPATSDAELLIASLAEIKQLKTLLAN